MSGPLFNTWAYLPNIATLRSLGGLTLCDQAADVVNVTGYYSPSVTSTPDGGGGTFVYDATDTTTVDDGGMVIVDTVGRRWKRQTESKNINVRWFGAIADWAGGASGTDNTVAFQAAIDYVSKQTFPPNAIVLYVPSGLYRIGDTLTQTGQMTWRGDGKDGTNGDFGGSTIGFNHLKSYCIALNSTTSLSTMSRFEDIALFGVNQTVEQHCIALLGGGSIHNGGLHNVGFFNFTGCCIHVPTGSNAYNQNLSIINVSASFVGGFYGVASGISLTNTIMLVQNFAGNNGANTAFPQPVYFDFLSCREIICHAIDVEGGPLPDTIFRLGSNNWAVIDGLHVEDGPPVDIFRIATGGYPFGVGGTKLNVRNAVAGFSGKFLKFDTGVDFTRARLENIGQGNDITREMVDLGDGANNIVELYYGDQSGMIDIVANNISKFRIPRTTVTQPSPTINILAVHQVDIPVVDLRGQWLDGAFGGTVTMAVDPASVTNIGMYTDATEGRVFELVSIADTLPKFTLTITPPAELVSGQVSAVIRYYVDTADANLAMVPVNPIQGGNPPTAYAYIGDTAPTPPPAPYPPLPLNTWHTAQAVYRPPNTTASIVTNVIVPSSPAPVGVTKYRISAVYVTFGIETTYLIGGGAATKPITWRATAAPSYGVYVVGDHVINSVPTVGQPLGWVCTVAGSPGTWVALANL